MKLNLGQLILLPLYMKSQQKLYFSAIMKFNVED